jgi:hypothetical protein
MSAIGTSTDLARTGTEMHAAGLWNNRSLTIRAHDLAEFGWASAREPLLVCRRDGSFVLVTGDGKNLATGLRRKERR